MKDYSNLIRVRPTTARKLFNEGETLYLLPNKVRLNNPWISPYIVNTQSAEGATFEQISNAYTYYNCNSETGKTIAYYRLDPNNSTDN